MSSGLVVRSSALPDGLMRSWRSRKLFPSRRRQASCCVSAFFSITFDHVSLLAQALKWRKGADAEKCGTSTRALFLAARAVISAIPAPSEGVSLSLLRSMRRKTASSDGASRRACSACEAAVVPSCPKSMGTGESCEGEGSGRQREARASGWPDCTVKLVPVIHLRVCTRGSRGSGRRKKVRGYLGHSRVGCADSDSLAITHDSRRARSSQGAMQASTSSHNPLPAQ